MSARMRPFQRSLPMQLMLAREAVMQRVRPHLKAGGLVSRKADTQDQRRVSVSLTAKGRKLFETVAPQSEAIYAQLAREIGTQRMEQIYGLLDEVIGILEKPRPQVKSAAARSRVAVRRGKAQ
jgi:DNA-binding MarR family transcriptional regulator